MAYTDQDLHTASPSQNRAFLRTLPEVCAYGGDLIPRYFCLASRFRKCEQASIHINTMTTRADVIHLCSHNWARSTYAVLTRTTKQASATKLYKTKKIFVLMPYGINN